MNSYSWLFFKMRNNSLKGCNNYFLVGVLISTINIFLNKQTFYMYITIMTIKIIKITNLSFKFKKYYFFRKYNFMNKIFPKIYLKFDLKRFHSIVFRVLLLCCHQTN